MREILISIGLGLNLFGAILLVIPTLKSKMWLKDDFIVKSGKDNKGEFWYERKGVKKVMCYALAGIVLLVLGFALQVIAQYLKINP